MKWSNEKTWKNGRDFLQYQNEKDLFGSHIVYYVINSFPMRSTKEIKLGAAAIN